jgi:diketogulonate reductase-like aldo/keto reductase
LRQADSYAQQGFVPLPKSATDARIVENADVYDFELSAEDMESLNTGEYHNVCWDPTIHKDTDPLPK